MTVMTLDDMFLGTLKDLCEEQSADKKLSRLAEEYINQKAAA
jgi:ferritin-like metal-binding protein YciE